MLFRSVFKTANVGVWERGEFVGVIIFASGASPDLVKPYGLAKTEGCELVRVALRKHASAVSKMIAIAIRMLKKKMPGLRLIVSFADQEQNHHGGIYQAGGWVYTGSQTLHAYKINGKIEHPKTLHSRYGVGGQSIPWLRANVDPGAERIRNGLKHRYLMPLDDAMRRQVQQLARPYPKRTNAAASSEDPDVQSGQGGSTPTQPLQGA